MQRAATESELRRKCSISRVSDIPCLFGLAADIDASVGAERVIEGSLGLRATTPVVVDHAFSFTRLFVVRCTMRSGTLALMRDNSR